MSGRQVKISAVWDRTLDVLRGRGAIVTVIALLFLLLPNLLGNAIGAYGGTGAGVRTVAGLVNIVATLLLVTGLLAITAVATDPAVDRAQGLAIGVRRLGPALACIVVLAVLALLALVPVTWLLFSSGATYNAATGRIDVANASAGTIALAGLLSIALMIAGLWLSARLVPLFGVVVNERLGLRALTRSFALSRGAGLRLMGVIILYAVVLVVLGIATTSVVGVVARLLLGAEAAASVAFAVAVVGAVLTAIASTVQAVFYAQFYIAARDAGAGMTPDA